MNRKALTNRLRSQEGYSATPYRDTKRIWTVGVGHNIHHDDISAFETLGAALDHFSDPGRHEFWLQQDISNAITESNNWIPHEGLTEARQQVITEMFFVLGMNRAKLFVRFKAAVVAGDHGQASYELVDSLWGKSKAANRVAGMAEIWAEG